MKLLLLIIIGMLGAILLSLVALFYWIRGVQERTDIILSSIQAEMATRENRVLMIVQRLERIFKLRSLS